MPMPFSTLIAPTLTWLDIGLQAFFQVRSSTVLEGQRQVAAHITVVLFLSGKTPKRPGQVDRLFRKIVAFCRQMVTAPPWSVRIRRHKDKKAISIVFLCSPVTVIGYIATVLRESFPHG